jgi:thioredoxin 1
VEQLATDNAGKVNVGKLDVDSNPEVSTKYGIRSIPTILFIKGGQVVDKVVGAVPKAQLQSTIDKHI